MSNNFIFGALTVISLVQSVNKRSSITKSQINMQQPGLSLIIGSPKLLYLVKADELLALVVQLLLLLLLLDSCVTTSSPHQSTTSSSSAFRAFSHRATVCFRLTGTTMVITVSSSSCRQLCFSRYFAFQTLSLTGNLFLSVTQQKYQNFWLLKNDRSSVFKTDFLMYLLYFTCILLRTKSASSVIVLYSEIGRARTPHRVVCPTNLLQLEED